MRECRTVLCGELMAYAHLMILEYEIDFQAGTAARYDTSRAFPTLLMGRDALQAFGAYLLCDASGFAVDAMCITDITL